MRAARWIRRAALTVLAVIVGLGASGYLGVHSDTATAATPGYQLRVTYPRVAQAGLDVPWQLTLHSDTGFGGHDIKVAISADYYDIFEFQGFHPQPSDETADANFDYLTFPAPAGDTFTLRLDTYVQPASQLGRDVVTEAFVGGRLVGRVHYTTTLLP